MVQTHYIDFLKVVSDNKHQQAFVYYIERPDGTVEEETFASHYRPLPTICRVGALPEQIGEDGQLIETPPAEPEPSVDAPVKPSPEPTAPEPTE